MFSRIIALLLALVAVGCVPIRPANRPIDSVPQGAMVYLDGVPVGKTPTALRLEGDNSQKFSHIVKLELEGHEVLQVPISNSYQVPQESFGGGFARGLAGGAPPSGAFLWPSSFMYRLAAKRGEE